jgi:hypothetical protein
LLIYGDAAGVQAYVKFTADGYRAMEINGSTPYKTYEAYFDGSQPIELEPLPIGHAVAESCLQPSN